jgi:hypothetical protein
VEKTCIFFKTTDGQWLSLGLATVNETKLSLNPADLLNSITKTQDLKTLKDSLYKHNDLSLNVLSFIELNNLISQSLLSRDSNQVWINRQQLDTLLQPEVFKIYLGLLLAKTQKNNNKETITFDSILIDNYNRKNEKYVFFKMNCAIFFYTRKGKSIIAKTKGTLFQTKSYFCKKKS